MRLKLAVLLIVALVGSYALHYHLTRHAGAERGTPKITAEHRTQSDVETIPVLVAKRNLSLGWLINEPEKLFEEKQFPKSEVPEKAILSFAELRDRRLSKPLAAEQFVTADDLIEINKDKEPPLAPGMRAVTLEVNAEPTPSGFVLPPSHVDIVSVALQADGTTRSETILRNVLVLAPNGSEKANTVTVLVTPEQVEKLALAQKMGSISVVPRPLVYPAIEP
jgi:pilus assembly protein CpaB